MHIVLPLKDDARDKDVAAALERRQIRCRTMSDLYLKKFKRNGLILGYSTYREQDILAKRDGVQIIAESILRDPDGLLQHRPNDVAQREDDAA